MPVFSRAGVTYACGTTLVGVSQGLGALANASSQARVAALDVLVSEAVSVLPQLDAVIHSCRAAQNMYANYPTLRSCIAEAGEAISQLYPLIFDVVQRFKNAVATSPDGDFSSFAVRFLQFGTTLRLIRFTPLKIKNNPVRSPEVVAPGSAMDADNKI